MHGIYTEFGTSSVSEKKPSTIGAPSLLNHFQDNKKNIEGYMPSTSMQCDKSVAPYAI